MSKAVAIELFYYFCFIAKNVCLTSKVNIPKISDHFEMSFFLLNVLQNEIMLQLFNCE